MTVEGNNLQDSLSNAIESADIIFDERFLNLDVIQEIQSHQVSEVLTPEEELGFTTRIQTLLSVDEIKTKDMEEVHQLSKRLIAHSNRSPEEIEKQKAILKEIRSSVENADHIYIRIGGFIGDTLVHSGYMHGIIQAIQQMELATPITILTDEEYLQDLGFAQFASDQVNVTLYPSQSMLREEKVVKQMIKDTSVNGFVFDLYSVPDNQFYPELARKKSGDRIVTSLRRFTATADWVYKDETIENTRWAAPIEDILSFSRGDLDTRSIHPQLPLPSNEEQRYREIAESNGINSTKSGLVIHMGGSTPGKRWSLENYAIVAERFHALHPDWNITVIVDSMPKSRSIDYTSENIANIFDAHNLAGGYTMIQGKLMDMAIFLKHQQILLTNDTGMSHIAAAVNGPDVIVPFVQTMYDPRVWLWSKKQFGVFINDDKLHDSLRNADISEAANEKKAINLIEPDQVSSVIELHVSSTFS